MISGSRAVRWNRFARLSAPLSRSTVKSFLARVPRGAGFVGPSSTSARPSTSSEIRARALGMVMTASWYWSRRSPVMKKKSTMPGRNTLMVQESTRAAGSTRQHPSSRSGQRCAFAPTPCATRGGASWGGRRSWGFRGRQPCATLAGSKWGAQPGESDYDRGENRRASRRSSDASRISKPSLTRTGFTFDEGVSWLTPSVPVRFLPRIFDRSVAMAAPFSAQSPEQLTLRRNCSS
jgi:hypothetical protein